MYFYCAFGLLLRSERYFEELMPHSVHEGDSVLICWGETPAELDHPYTGHGLLQARVGELLLSIPGVARYYVTPNAVVVTPDPEAAEATVRLFLFGSAMGALLHLHGILALHGSAVRLPSGGSAAFCGIATAGKSTLAAALTRLGCSLLADDLVAVRFDETGQPWTHPGLALSKLWKDAFEKLALPPGIPVRDGIEKYFHSSDTSARPEPLRHVYEIIPENRKGVATVSGVSGMETVPVFLRNTFRPSMIRLIGSRADHLRRVGALAGRTAVHTIGRPLYSNTLPVLTEMLVREWA